MSVPPKMTPAILASAMATANPKDMPAAQPQATVIAIHRASTAAMIAPRPHTAFEVAVEPRSDTRVRAYDLNDRGDVSAALFRLADDADSGRGDDDAGG